MAVVKAKKAVQKASKKVVKATKARAVKSEKKKKKPSLARYVYQSVVETLEFNVLGGGEYDLPSILTKVNDQSDPRYKLGLHREYYIPVLTKVPYYRVGEPNLRTLLGYQAGLILPAFTEGIKITKLDDPDLPLCRECK